MKEIVALKSNGLTVASFFAGAGGSSTGYRMAGFKVLYANEFVPIAAESYKANAAPHTFVDSRDIKTVTAAEVLKACKLKRGELDVLDGSPPCQAFSMAGKRDKGWGTEKSYEHGAKQKNEELFTDFIRVRDGVMPKVFVAENVKGLVTGTAKGFFLEILAELRRGYRVIVPLLDAQWLGVPQARQRIVFIGVRNDLGLDPVFPDPLPYFYSVRDALPDIGRVLHDTGGQPQYSGGDVTERPSPTITCGGEVSNAYHFKVEHDAGRGKSKNILDRPAPTITAGPNSAAEGGGPRNHFKVVHETHGQHKSYGDVSERPAPPVVASRPATFSVELVGNKNAPHSGKGKRRGIDEPVNTIIARRQTVDVEVRKIGVNDVVGENVAATLEGYAIGAEWDKLNPGQQSDKFFSLVRPDADQPCPTITASAAGGEDSGSPGSTAAVTHPTEKRKFTIAEVKALCGFPPDFVLLGTYGQQWERCGNSVPPLMMKALAEVLRDRVLIPARNGVKTPGNLPAGASAAPGTAIRRQKKNKRTSEARS
jgi:DNA (cytosine-5)-methyltransferase 1